MPKRYFTYRSLSELREDAGRLQVDLPLVEDRDEVRRLLAQPVEIKGRGGRSRRVGNRLAVQPMEGCDGEPDGTPGELTFRRYRRFGSGGAKLVWFEACAVVPEGRANPRQLWIHSGSAKRLEDLLNACREAHRRQFGACDDLVTILQLTHSGRYSFEKPLAACRHTVLDRLPGANRATSPRETLPELASDDDLATLEERFVEAAKLAQEIGFDGVDLKMTHGYLLAELMSARSRQGAYGGTLSNRARFALNVIRKIRRQAGDGFIPAVRLGVYDGVPYAAGLPRAVPSPDERGFGVDASDPSRVDLAEPLSVIGWLQEAGVRLLNVSMGVPYFNPHITRPFEKPNEGSYETPEHPLVGVARHFAATAEIQKAYPDLAVVGSGYSWLQHYLVNAAAANLKLYRTTFAGLGRAMLAYPTLAREALAKGELDPLRTCKTLSYCTYLMRSKHHPLGQFPTGCPPFDKEAYGAVVKEARAAARKATEKR